MTEEIVIILSNDEMELEILLEIEKEMSAISIKKIPKKIGLDLIEVHQLDLETQKRIGTEVQ
jgi:hypothetical protein